MNFGNISKLQLEDIFMSFGDENLNRELKNDKNKCSSCGNSDEFIEDYKLGSVICNCGQIISDLYDVAPEKTVSHDKEEKINNNITYNSLLPQSTMTTNSNLKGTMLKLQIWDSMPAKERSNNIMFKKIKKICEIYKINKKIENEAKMMFKKVSETKHQIGKNKGKVIITRGNNRKGILASCLAKACRNNEETRTTKEIANYFNIKEKDVNEGNKNLENILCDKNDSNKNIVKPSHFIQRKCDELHIKSKDTLVALKIALNLEKLNIASNHTTETIAAACIYLMTIRQNIKEVTKKEISIVFDNLSDATIIKTYKEIKNYENILVDDTKINKICAYINEYIEKKYVNKDIWNLMCKFGVNKSEYTLIE